MFIIFTVLGVGLWLTQGKIVYLMLAWGMFAAWETFTRIKRGF